jgi:hypothetical protein
MTEFISQNMIKRGQNRKKISDQLSHWTHAALIIFYIWFLTVVKFLVMFEH